jgi:putative membrane protein
MADFLAQHYLVLKALHLSAVIAWMAGMMYLPRLFIYHLDAARGGEGEAFFVKMERRLLKGVMTPSLVAVWLFAILMLTANPALLKAGWFQVKLPMVIGISAIHGFYAVNQKKFERGERPRSDRFWRIINEVPFVLMLAAVFLAVMKPF